MAKMAAVIWIFQILLKRKSCYDMIWYDIIASYYTLHDESNYLENLDVLPISQVILIDK